MMATRDDPLMARAKALKLYGLLAHWEEVAGEPWIEPLIQWEEQERARRSLERRLGNAKLGRFRPLAETAVDTLDWWRSQPEARRANPRLWPTPEQERAALERLASDPDLRCRLAGAGQAQVARDYDITQTAEVYVRRFRETTESNPGRTDTAARSA